jgi:TPR repeat protein
MKGRAIRFGALALAVSVACGAFALSRTPERQVDEWRMRALSTRDWTSLSKLRAASWSGSDAAAFALGSVLIGDGDASRVREGIGWLERSGEAGDVQAQLMLGRAYLNGAAGMAPDYAQSRVWLERAARSLPAKPPVTVDAEDHAPPAGAQAAYSLASIYRNGYGVPRDPAAGLRWLTLAAAWGVPQAQFQLANVHRERGDDAQALVWLRRAAASENPEANLALAIAYRNGELGLRKDEGEYWSYVKETLHDYKHRAEP